MATATAMTVAAAVHATAPAAASGPRVRRLAPSRPLVALAAVPLACACLAPAWAAAARTAWLLAGALCAAALLDLAWGQWRGSRLAASLNTTTASADPRFVAGGDGGAARTLAGRIACTTGQPLRLRLRLAAVGPELRPLRVRLVWMAADESLEAHLRLPTGATVLRLAGAGPWIHDFELQPQRRGLAEGLRCGLEYRSRLGLWRVLERQTLAERFRVDPDLAHARRLLLTSPVYRAVVAHARVPLTGQGREFERLRDYQSGDGYSDISWKATARRAAPVTRLFQWEQRQQIYFVVDHSRTSGRTPPGSKTCWLDRYVLTALAGAAAAADVGDEFGLITFAERVSGWLPAACGPGQFSRMRDRLVGLQPSAAPAGYDRLFADIRVRLRRRAYLLLCTSPVEPGVDETFAQAAAGISGTHLTLVNGILPEDIAPLFTGAPVATLEDVYGRFAGDLDWQRLEAFAHRLGRMGIQLRLVRASQLMRAAVEGYLESKRGQRL